MCVCVRDLNPLSRMRARNISSLSVSAKVDHSFPEIGIYLIFNNLFILNHNLNKSTALLDIQREY